MKSTSNSLKSLVYVTTDNVVDFKKNHITTDESDEYYDSICFLQGTNQILTKGQIFGSTYKLLDSQEEYDALKSEDKLDAYTLYLIKESE